ncbi:hypothetical protein [Mycobacterium sp.]|uniref:hypothetical protein n=1 Tax=Mycobacterium sp. TaxID=1785 RepID=UPI003D0DDBB5
MQNVGTRTVAAVVAACIPMLGVSLYSCGNATADGLSSWIEHELGPLADEFAEVQRPTIISRGRAALAPSLSEAAQNNDRGERILNGACTINKWNMRGNRLDNYLNDNYTPYEQLKIRQQYELLDDLGVWDEGPGGQMVQKICQARS